ncbi:hypothetical protein ABBQ32_001164 [Trebouxia sp. C0010 RCD-2024]
MLNHSVNSLGLANPGGYDPRASQGAYQQPQRQYDDRQAYGSGQFYPGMPGARFVPPHQQPVGPGYAPPVAGGYTSYAPPAGQRSEPFSRGPGPRDPYARDAYSREPYSRSGRPPYQAPADLYGPPPGYGHPRDPYALQSRDPYAAPSRQPYAPPSRAAYPVAEYQPPYGAAHSQAPPPWQAQQPGPASNRRPADYSSNPYAPLQRDPRQR